jgi:hypothetical protein
MNHNIDKSQFNRPFVFWITVSVLGYFILHNLGGLVVAQDLVAILPIVIQSILMGLVLTKHKYARIAILGWSMVVLIVASGLILTGQFVIDAVAGFSAPPVALYVRHSIYLVVGIILYKLTKGTVTVVARTMTASTPLPDPNNAA